MRAAALGVTDSGGGSARRPPPLFLAGWAPAEVASAAAGAVLKKLGVRGLCET